MERDARIKEALKQAGVEAESFNGSLLWEPWEIQKNDGTPYRVFTPFYRKGCMYATAPREPMSKPAKLNKIKDNEAMTLEVLSLLPHIRWDTQLEPHWQIVEKAAQERLYAFLD